MRIAAKSMFSDSDPETLVARAIGGDREAFEGIARRYLRVAYAVALACIPVLLILLKQFIQSLTGSLPK